MEDSNGPAGTPFFPVPPPPFWIENDRFYPYPTTTVDLPTNWWSETRCDVYAEIDQVDMRRSVCSNENTAANGTYVCVAVCNDGFVVDDPASKNATNQTLRCNGTDFLDPPYPCIEKRCTAPPMGSNMNVTASTGACANGAPGDTCRIVCDDGFEAQPSDVATCTAGSWNVDGVVCARWGDRAYGWPALKIVVFVLSIVLGPLLCMYAYWSELCCLPFNELRRRLPTPLWCLFPSPSEYLHVPVFSRGTLDRMCKSRSCLKAPRTCRNPCYYACGACSADRRFERCCLSSRCGCVGCDRMPSKRLVSCTSPAQDTRPISRLHRRSFSFLVSHSRRFFGAAALCFRLFLALDAVRDQRRHRNLSFGVSHRRSRGG